MAQSSSSQQTSSGMPLRIDLGFSGANAADSGVVGQALAFGGVGTRLGVGTSLALTEDIQMVAEVGYHGMFGAGEDPTKGVGYQATPTVYHGVFTWLAGSMTFSSLEVLVGPIVEFASVQTQGLSLNPAMLEYSLGKGITYLCKGCCWLLGCQVVFPMLRLRWEMEYKVVCRRM